MKKVKLVLHLKGGAKKLSGLKMLKTRLDGVQQHYTIVPNVKMTKLVKRAMGKGKHLDLVPQRKIVPNRVPQVQNYAYLKGTPRQIVDRVLTFLRQDYPLPREPKVRLISSSPNTPVAQRYDLLRLYKDWSITSPREQMAAAQNYAVHHRQTREIALLGDAVEDLSSNDAMRRVSGLFGLCHEYWHALRITPSTYSPDVLEEATADYFARMVVQQLTGYRVTNDEIGYAGYADRLTDLLYLIGPKNTWTRWILESRQQTDLQVWVKNSLTQRGITHQEADTLTYNLFAP